MQEQEPDHRDNLTRLLNLGRRKRARVNKGYTFLVRGLKLLLPLIALGIVAVVIAWPRMDEAIAPVPKETILPQAAGSNELIKPRYESTDRNDNPYVITADRANQSAGNQNLVMLEKPVAEMTMKSGEKLSASARDGTYSQTDQALILSGDVVINHSSGYVLRTQALDIALKSDLATTDQTVAITGPDADLKAAGMTADNTAGTLVFGGPARLVLKQGIKGF